MPDIPDGESVEVQGSGAKPYVLKNVGGVYSCTCPAWRNQSVGPERRTCKHLRKYRGDDAEEARLGGALPAKPVRAKDDDAASSEPALLLAEQWDNSLDPQGWWMSEKLDGVRAYWDGKQFLSRQGNLYHAPDWFIAGLPSTPLDGELWLDRKAFQRTVSIVRRQDKGEPWRTIRYLVFDAPAAGGPFEDRLQFLKDEVGRWKNSFTSLHEHAICRDVEHLREELKRIESLGGEGLMLREPRSKYIAGRSSSLLKVKTFFDAEATVLRHEPGKGRHEGRLGALTVRLPNGKEFSVGTGFSDRDRERPPAIGSLITFRYQELSDAGIPRFPSYVGLRRDVPQQPPAAAKKEAESQPAKPAKKGAKVSVSAKPAKTSEPALPSSRYFECQEGTSNKFWEVGVVGTKLTVRWGRIGSKGQSKTKTLPSSDAAWAERDSLIESKLSNGYHEIAAKPPGSSLK
jgi:DNA ligase 1